MRKTRNSSAQRRSPLRAIASLSSLIALACSGSGYNGESVGASSEAVLGSAPVSLSSTQARILGFESVGDWTQSVGTAALSSNTDHVEGTASLALSQVTNSQLKSASFGKFAGGFSNVDISIQNQASASTVGTVTLGINSLHGEPQNGVIGTATLKAASSAFQTYSFAVPPWINQSIANLGNGSVFFTVSVTFTQASNVKLDAIVPRGTATDTKTAPYASLPDAADAFLPSAPEGQTVPGRIEGTSTVDATGAFNYRLSIQVPTGRAGMEPKLGFAYLSSGRNGLLGVGWALQGPSTIARCRSTMARDGFADSIKVKVKDYCTASSNPSCGEQFQEYQPGVDHFCLDGEKLVYVGGTSTAPEFRTEHESFSKIVANYTGDNWPSTFTVWQRDGNIATYAVGPAVSGNDRRDFTTGAPVGADYTGVLNWPLASVQDRAGNAIDYSYRPADTNSAAVVPDSIRYTTCAAESPCPYGGASRLVKFNYETRPDYLSAWVGGLNSGGNLRLKNVSAYTLASSKQTLVRSYNLSYEQSGATERSRLTDITLCDGGGACFAPLHFQWGAGQAGDFRPTWHVLGSEPAGTVTPGQCTPGSRTGMLQRSIRAAARFTFRRKEWRYSRRLRRKRFRRHLPAQWLHSLWLPQSRKCHLPHRPVEQW